MTKAKATKSRRQTRLKLRRRPDRGCSCSPCFVVLDDLDDIVGDAPTLFADEVGEATTEWAVEGKRLVRRSSVRTASDFLVALAHVHVHVAHMHLHSKRFVHDALAHTMIAAYHAAEAVQLIADSCELRGYR